MEPDSIPARIMGVLTQLESVSWERHTCRDTHPGQMALIRMPSLAYVLASCGVSSPSGVVVDVETHQLRDGDNGYPLLASYQEQNARIEVTHHALLLYMDQWQRQQVEQRHQTSTRDSQ